MHQKLIRLPCSHVQVNPRQPRKEFLQEELEELAQSIRSVGLIHPPIVRALNSEHYEIVSGERRFRAALLADLKEIPVIVISCSPDNSAAASLIENIQRVDLNPIEIARALKSLIEIFNFQQEEIAEKIGKKRATVANYIRLLALPYPVQEGVSNGIISMGHAKAILSAGAYEKQLQVYQEVVKKELSVREAEKAAKNTSKKTPAAEKAEGNCFLKDLQEKMQQKLGTKVSIQGNGINGTITIDYFSLDDLERVAELIGSSPFL